MYVQATSSATELSWSIAADFSLLLNVSEIVAPDINFAPYFDDLIEAKSFQISEEQKDFEFVLPTYSDPENDAVTLTVSDLASFMTFDVTSRKISMPAAEPGTYEIKAILEDVNSNSKTTSISIEVIAMEVEEAEQPVEESEEEKTVQEEASSSSSAASASPVANLAFMQDFLNSFEAEETEEEEQQV